ncbi:hypothetical protein HQQ81_20130 [Microbacteriaceae bacterium VKM Ac-2854]|nr:hypothetical protein [Microbacteriaceae bacterium VKM Ac-2854]
MAGSVLAADIPDPGDGSMPPGFERFEDVIGWVKWIALGVAVIGLIILGATLAISSRRGEGMEIGGWLGRILIGVIIIAGAVGLVSFFVGG